MTRPFRLRRSELSTPGSSPRMMKKAAASRADLVFLDLEDAVAPSEKVSARSNIVDALTGLDWTGKTRAVRINGVQTQWCHDDIEEIVVGAGRNLDVLIVPKVMAPRDVWFVESALDQLEEKLGLVPGRIGLEVLIEEVEAVARVDEIAACSPRLEALILGVGDLSASQGMRSGHIGEASQRYPGDIWHYARTRVVIAARSNGLDAIDGPYANIANAEGYRREASWAAAIGAVGKWAIHPDQIVIANEVYGPSEKELIQARTALAQAKAAEEAGEGAVKVDGMMVDAATTRIYQAVVDRMERIEEAERRFANVVA